MQFKLFHTIRFLRPSQIGWRIVRKLYQPRPVLASAPAVRPVREAWARPVSKHVSLVAADQVCFLNQTGHIGTAQAWNDPTKDKLWLYNLHYFDDLNAKNANERVHWHTALIKRWIAENPPGRGNGWEPYPSSLRIVNWIKWALAGNRLPQEAVHSLAVQTRYLARNLEYHLLGNHLFANAKALVFAGAFFAGPEADTWMRKGLAILRREMREQILPDGGQFERSPMYHALALEDMADLVNIARAYPESVPGKRLSFVTTWPAIVEKMCNWLQVMRHPDGEIVLFNDAALGIAATPARLLAYCERLGVRGTFQNATSGRKFGAYHLADSGYIRVDGPECTAFLDCAPIGPDYLPGHGHADTLTFELSLFGRRVVVDTGTSCYGLGPDRLRQRGTAAHNTVVVNNENSSEVWSGFRVARRALPKKLRVEHDDGSRITVRCAHDGYARLPGKPIHERTWTFTPGQLEIMDLVRGGHDRAVAHWHMHPGVTCIQESSATIQLALSAGNTATLTCHGGVACLESRTWHPRFGACEPCLCVVVEFKGNLKTCLTWTP